MIIVIGLFPLERQRIRLHALVTRTRRHVKEHQKRLQKMEELKFLINLNSKHFTNSRFQNDCRRLVGQVLAAEADKFSFFFFFSPKSAYIYVCYASTSIYDDWTAHTSHAFSPRTFLQSQIITPMLLKTVHQSIVF